jgi:NADH-quinone oxidoreductase subunit J
MVNAIFYLFVIITLASALVVVASKKLVHSAFALLGTFGGLAALYIFLYADFVAIAQIMIYAGGILVLLIFGVMLTQKVSSADISLGTVQKVYGLILSLILFGMLAVVVFVTPWYFAESVLVKGTTRGIGELFMVEYLLPFEVASLLLLGALIGAATLARRKV